MEWEREDFVRRSNLLQLEAKTDKKIYEIFEDEFFSKREEDGTYDPIYRAYEYVTDGLSLYTFLLSAILCELEEIEIEIRGSGSDTEMYISMFCGELSSVDLNHKGINDLIYFAEMLLEDIKKLASESGVLDTYRLADIISIKY